MKGVILAGGSGTRLNPFTLVTNKHLLPVYDKPVIHYAVEKMVSAGIDKIMIVTSSHHQGDFVKIFGSGQNFISKNTGKQIQIVYGVQNKPSGIADGLYIAKDYIGDDNCTLYLGDNIIEDDISEHVKNFKSGATVFLKEVKDPERFGVATTDEHNNVLEIIEKPQNPKSNTAVVGVYIYDNSVFRKMIGQPKSDRGEYEITYLNNKYIEEGGLNAVLLEKKWFDVGTIDSLIEVGSYMKGKQAIASRVPSISVFFPCYNDKGTIATMVLEAKKVVEDLTNDYEIIVIDDGSSDGSQNLLLELQREIPQLKVVFHEKNRGYGGALRSGFQAATKDLIFYTDGDAQYDVNELPLLVEKLEDNIDIVNGYKTKRSDPMHRIVVGFVYQHLMRLFFALPVKDPDCDFRLIRKKVFDDIKLKSNTGTITIELVKKIQRAGFRFAQVGVSHRFRVHGESQFFNFSRVAKTLWKLMFLWFELMSPKRLLTNPSVAIVLRRIVERNFTEQKKVIKKYFSDLREDKVLDLGCGSGEFSVFFPEKNYTGIDIDKPSIRYARKKYKKNFLESDARALDFSDNSFDKILVAGVFHHLNNKDCLSVLKEAKRVLKPKGKMIVMEDLKKPDNGFLTRLLHRFDQGDFIRTKEEYSDLLSSHFSVIESFSIKSGICPYQIFVLNHYEK